MSGFMTWLILTITLAFRPNFGSSPCNLMDEKILKDIKQIQTAWFE